MVKEKVGPYITRSLHVAIKDLVVSNVGSLPVNLQCMMQYMYVE